MASGRLVDYLGSGVIASRPASLTLHTDSVGLWYATDTNILSAWDGSTWTDVTSSSSVVDFTDLGDVPASYVGEAGKVVAVNVGETGLEFIAASGTGTVTSVDVANATGITWTGNPITTAGTLTPALSANLQAWHGLATSAKQDADADLTDIAALTPANDDIIQRKAGAWTNRTMAQLTTDLGLGTAALANIGTSGATIPLLNGNNTYSGTSTFTQDIAVNLTAAAGAITLSTDAGQLADYRLATAGVNRWLIRKDVSAESGGNTGSNLQIKRLSDAGSLLSNSITIDRATGDVVFADRVLLNTDEVGFRTIPQNSRSAAYTLVLSDSGKHIFHPSADTTARIWTIPANASVAYPIGTALTFINQNAAGVITIAITSDTMRLAGAGTTGSRTLAANGIATAVKVTATEWIISGTGLT